MLLLEIQQNMVPQLFAAYDKQEKEWKEGKGILLGKPEKYTKDSVFYMHLIPLEQPVSLVTLPLIAQITCICSHGGSLQRRPLGIPQPPCGTDGLSATPPSTRFG